MPEEGQAGSLAGEGQLERGAARPITLEEQRHLAELGLEALVESAEIREMHALETAKALCPECSDPHALPLREVYSM